MSDKPEKTVTIRIETRPYEVEKADISYDDVLNLHYDNDPPKGEDVVIVVEWSRGPNDQPNGQLDPGETVKAKDGMRFTLDVSTDS